MVPLAIEESPLKTHEERSPTLMIQGVLRELAPEEEVAEAQGAIKEEGSNPTPE